MIFSQTATLRDAAVLSSNLNPDEIVLHWVNHDETEQTVTRREFIQKSQHVAQILQSQSYLPGTVILIINGHDLAVIYAFWGCILAGFVPSMMPSLNEKLDASYYLNNISSVLSTSSVGVIMCQHDQMKQLQQLSIAEDIDFIAFDDFSRDESVAVDESHDAESLPSSPSSPAPADAVALIQHSSGTTGVQKGVALSHRAILTQLDAYHHAIELSTGDIIVSWLPLYHDMGLIAAFIMPLVLGIPVVMMSPFDWVARPAMLLRALDHHRGTLCWLPNFAYNHMAQRVRNQDVANIDLSCVRAFINCSEPIRDTSHRQFVDRFTSVGVSRTQMQTCYAMAETTFAMTQSMLGNEVITAGLTSASFAIGESVTSKTNENANTIAVSSGVPIDGVRVRIVDDTHRVLDDSVCGYIQVRSSSLFSGYTGGTHKAVAQPDEAVTSEDAWFDTGDIGFVQQDELFVVGRRKELIIHAGKNILPADIDNVVNGLHDVHSGRCVSFGLFDEADGTEHIVVLVEAYSDTHRRQENKQQDESDVNEALDVDNTSGQTQRNIVLKSRIRKTVSESLQVPVRYIDIVPAGWLIKTSSGKIARYANREKWLQSDSRINPHNPMKR